MLTIAAVFVFGVGSAGCEKRGASSPTAGPARTPEKVYTSRGRVESLPDPKRPTAEFIVYHEPIDDFINPNGSKGMGSMSMPLTPAPTADLSGLKVGDIIEFDLAVWYAPEFKSIESFRVTRIKKLPAETPLRSGKATPTL